MKSSEFKGVSLAYIAEKMGKSRQWLYQRLNGSIVNGKPAVFKKIEKRLFKKALVEFQNELSEIIANVKTD